MFGEKATARVRAIGGGVSQHRDLLDVNDSKTPKRFRDLGGGGGGLRNEYDRKNVVSRVWQKMGIGFEPNWVVKTGEGSEREEKGFPGECQPKGEKQEAGGQY